MIAKANTDTRVKTRFSSGLILGSSDIVCSFLIYSYLMLLYKNVNLLKLLTPYSNNIFSKSSLSSSFTGPTRLR